MTLRQAGAGAGAAAAGQAPAALYDRMFLLGQSLMPVANALLLGSLLYRSRLVPRILPLLGFIGVPLLLTVQAAVLFGLLARVSPSAGIAALPIVAGEFSLGGWLVVKGFKLPEGLVRKDALGGWNTRHGCNRTRLPIVLILGDHHEKIGISLRAPLFPEARSRRPGRRRVPAVPAAGRR